MHPTRRFQSPKSFSAVLAAAALVALLSVAPAIDEAFAQALPGGSSPTGANISATRHNLSTSAPTRQITSGNTSTTEAIIQPAAGQGDEICVFCHTPHGAAPDAPLWNRSMSGASYTPYSSASLQASDLDVDTALATPSKLCLSCHDGTIAIGQVSNAPGSGAGAVGAQGQRITITGGSGAGNQFMPFGRGQANASHGFTRNLGTDLRNDHPIAFTYNTPLANADGELRDPATSSSPTKIGNRLVGQPKPDFPLVNDTVQCSTCHEPHRNTQKFLNKNRMQMRALGPATQGYSDWIFDDVNDQICLGCHTRLGKAWAVSAHANSAVANETYNAGDAAARDFPTGTTVAQAGCLNCHDTHTVGGSRRLLREGVNTGLNALSVGYTANIRAGTTSAADYASTSALENTCYQCHSGTGGPAPVIGPVALSATEGVPNIAQEFSRAVRMPITNNDQGGGSASFEVHDIADADGSESQTQLGFFSPDSRHVECTDCHNPHRVVKADTFLGGNLAGADTTRRTHVPARGTTGNQGNIASGALRGAWGVEPSYTASGQTTVTASSIWMSSAELPTFTEKRGDPGAASTLPNGSAGTNSVPYLTREYQLCFKCHSNYANGPLAGDFPSLGHPGGTSSGTNGMTRYTNVAQEFAVRAQDPPITGTPPITGSDQGENGNGATYEPTGNSWDTTTDGSTINHRSWHPVVFPTGRTGTERGNASFANIRPPFNVAAKIGVQTMQCSDCHGHSASWADGTGPNLSTVQGPHGSDQNFLLKGSWTTATALTGRDGDNVTGATDGSLCQNCHMPGAALNSGFAGDHIPDSNMEGTPCMKCHVAVPHGWKNKAFLVNNGCVGIEGGETSNCVSRTAWATGRTAAPYYANAALTVTQWANSGSWGGGNCSGCSGPMKDCGL